jgi:hypothetical protein
MRGSGGSQKRSTLHNGTFPPSQLLDRLAHVQPDAERSPTGRMTSGDAVKGEQSRITSDEPTS